MSTQIVQLAFQSAKAEAILFSDQQNAADNQPNSVSAQQKRFADIETRNQANIDQLKTRLATLDKQVAATSGEKYRNAMTQRNSLQGQLDLAQSMQQSLEKITSFAGLNAGATSGLSADIERLERTEPILFSTAVTVAPNAASSPAAKATGHASFAGTPEISLQSAPSTGVVGQVEILFDQLRNLHQLNISMADNDQLRAQASKLHDPLIALLRQTIQQGQALAQSAAAAMPSLAAPAKHGKAKAAAKVNPAIPAAAPVQPAPTLQDFERLAARFKQISAAAIPLTQEMMVLDRSHENLQLWSDAIDNEYDSTLRSVLLRVFAIALAIGVILLLGELWRRASVRYIHDLRRRRQLLVIRRFVIGFCMGIVLILGFVTQFSSLATFAGLLTAGVALGLQTILLSVAAYFFIVGRYGVRVGDRISVAGVTGDVIDVGIVRLYVMELAGTGIDLYPTGRLAVFSNAVLFQATTPLFKQIPGTEYGWHEVAIKLNETADYKPATQKIQAAIAAIYQKYQVEIERQHGIVESSWDIQTTMPRLDSFLQYVDTGLEFKVRYPVVIRKASQTDEDVTKALLALSQSDETVKSAIVGTPMIRSTVKV
ncbi:MAG TPA: hypothetical protein VMU62_05880 [Acidobacteriaceae bacterium]|nr:hypothetical protein [Acidobacteriaceae bacterium]